MFVSNRFRNTNRILRTIIRDIRYPGIILGYRLCLLRCKTKGMKWIMTSWIEKVQRQRNSAPKNLFLRITDPIHNSVHSMCKALSKPNHWRIPLCQSTSHKIRLQNSYLTTILRIMSRIEQLVEKYDFKSVLYYDPMQNALHKIFRIKIRLQNRIRLRFYANCPT